MISNYFRNKAKTIVLILSLLLVQTCVIGLYGVNMSHIFYANAVSSYFLVVYLLIDFILYRNKKIHFKFLKSQTLLNASELPSMRESFESDYQELIKNLVKRCEESETQFNQTVSVKNEYFAMWVHQVKTPIAAMSLLLQSDDVIDKHEIEEQLFKLEQYVDMVLQYLRIQDVTNDFVFERIDCDRIIKQVVRKYSKFFIRKKMTLVYDSVNVKAMTDEKWLCFVLEQILSNALKYTMDGGTIKIICDDKSIQISDTGIGIRAEDLPRVFENGYTGYNGRSDKKSTGIGLYLCKTICNKLGHSLEIDSKVSEGTTVKVGIESYLTKM